jgi:hypothetical protein
MVYSTLIMAEILECIKNDIALGIRQGPVLYIVQLVFMM